MAQQNTAATLMTADEFLLWIGEQDGRHELIDGYPVMMAGATRVHDSITANIGATIHGQLRGKPCRPHTADFAVKVSDNTIRYPDYSVDCGKPEGSDKVADAPTLVVEVLSRSTEAFDSERKLLEYKAVPTMRYILHINPKAPAALFYSRSDDGGWSEWHIIGLSSKIEMPLIGVSLSLADIYDGIELSVAENILPKSTKLGM